MNSKRLAFAATWALLGLGLALLWLAAGQMAAAQRAEITVCLAGPPTCDYDSVQAAVDAADEGDTIKVASGVYTGVQQRPVPPGYLSPPPSGLIRQMVYLSKTLAIQGGYTTTNWLTPDPSANPTTLDAQQQGRVLLIAGTISPTIEGLRITGGSAAGLGGYSGVNWPDHDTGGGVHVISATATLSGNVVFGNTAGAYGSGGGLYLLGDDSTLRNNTLTNNTANTLYGGGLYTLYSNATLAGNDFSGNTAGWGGAVFLEFSPATLDGNDFSGNMCASAGGALNVHTSNATLTGNTVTGNGATYGGAMRLYDSAAILSGNIISGNFTTDYGGGLHLWASPATLEGNIISYNQAGGDGGGLELWISAATLSSNTIISNTAVGNGGAMRLYQSNASLDNNVMAGNQIVGDGGGLYVQVSRPDLVHNTVAYNSSGDGSGVYVAAGCTVGLTDTILVGHTTGIYVASGSVADLEATLWGNGSDWDGPGTILTGTVNIWQDPAFVDPAAGDYHIGPGSGAIDAGVDAGVAVDVDGEPRPVGAGYDIGADEFPASLSVIKQASSDPVPAGSPLTYTLCVTNMGLVSLTTTIVDHLPAHVTPTGTLTWTPLLLPGNLWTETVVVTVEVGYAGLLTNVVQVTTLEGATAVYTEVITSTVPEPSFSIYLPIVLGGH